MRISKTPGYHGKPKHTREVPSPFRPRQHLNGPIHFGVIFWGEDGNIQLVGGFKLLKNTFCFVFPFKDFHHELRRGSFFEQLNQHTSICSVSSLFIRVTQIPNLVKISSSAATWQVGQQCGTAVPHPGIGDWVVRRSKPVGDGPKFFGT